MNKVYTRIKWENVPSDATPINETNLNKMDYAIDEIDNRIISQDTIKANKTELNDLIKTWTIDEETGVITIVKANGEQVVFDLNIEKIPVSFSLSNDGILKMITEDGTVFSANIGAMIPVLTFNDSSQITVSSTGQGINKTYTFTIKNNSITEDKLQPNFLSDIKMESAKAEASQKSAEESEKNALRSAIRSESFAIGGTGSRLEEDTDNAKYYKEKAEEALSQMQAGSVTGVKGDSESTYRVGNVNITAENVGALSNTGNAGNNTVAFTSNDSGPDGEHAIYNVGKLTSGEKLATYMQRISQMFTNIRYVLKMLGTTDISSDGSKIGDGTVTGAISELNDSKQSTITGAAVSITQNKLTSSRALISNGNGNIGISGTTSTELGYLSGTTSKVQTQLNNKYPLTGGRIKGNVTIGPNYQINLEASNGNFGYIKEYAAQQMTIRSSNEEKQGIFYGVRDNVWTLAPDTGAGNGQDLYLGSPNHKYISVFATNGAIQTSDRNTKDNIHYLTDDDIYVQLIMKLLPCSFTFKNTNEHDTHDRTHIGFIAQDVEKAMTELGMTSLDFAGFCKDQKMISKVVKETVTDEETGEKKEIEKIVEDKIDGEYIYSLRYQEFIALITKAVQNTCRRMDGLESRLSQIEEKGGQP